MHTAVLGDGFAEKGRKAITIQGILHFISFQLQRHPLSSVQYRFRGKAERSMHSMLAISVRRATVISYEYMVARRRGAGE